METPDHEHAAHHSESHPAHKPNHFAEWCTCGRYRYRVTGGPWTAWEPWNDADGPNPANVTAEN